MKFWVFLCFLSGAIMAAEIKPNVVRTLAELPEETEYFLQGPASFDVDKKGAYYVVDWTAQVIFKWDAEGNFKKVIGKPGGGPGEFVFMGQGGPQGYLGIVDDTLYIYDGGRRAVQVFSEEGEYQGSKGIQMQLGRTNAFFIAEADRWIIDHASFMKTPPSLTVSILDAKTQKETTVVDRVDTGFERKSENGRVTGVVIKGYAERLVTAFNRSNSQLIVGYSGEAHFGVYSLDGKFLKKVPVNRIRREVNAADKKEFNELPWIKGNQFFSASFPERMPYYTSILPLGKKHFMVYEMSPFNRKVDGILIDDTGKVLGRYRFECGENGSLLGGNGRILRVQTDEEGLFSLQELKFGETS